MIFLLCTGVLSAQKNQFWEEFKAKSDSLIVNIDSDIETTLSQLSRMKLEEGEELDTNVYIDFLLKLGLENLIRGNYSESATEFTNALHLSEQSNDSLNLARSFKYLGNQFYYTNNPQKALNYLEKAEQIVVRLNNKAGEKLLSNINNSLGLVYQDIGEYDSAIVFYKKAIDLAEKIPNSDLATFLDNLAMAHEAKGEYEIAALQFEKSLEQYMKEGSLVDITWNAFHLCRAYNSLKNEKKAKEYLDLGREYVKKSQSLEGAVEMEYSATRHYILFDHKDSALSALLKYGLLNEELIEERAVRLQYDFESKYQLEKKEAALQLSKENEERLAAQNRTQKILIIFSVAILLVLTVVLILGKRFYKQKRKINEMELSIKDSKLDELLSSQESSVLAAIIKGQNEERERVAQELHDRLGGTLAALKMSLKQKVEVISKDEMEIVNEAVREVRSISHNLSAGVAQQFGFNQAVELLVERMKKSTDLQFEISLHNDISKLGQSVGIELYRVVQELLANTLKHAEATEVSLQTNFNGVVFNLIYEDNGKGFEANSSNTTNGIGLFNVKQRVNGVGGNLNIDSMPNRGTIIIIDIDVNQIA